MIVKNEEKNIERALTWAKKVAYEQIVVDTGSTDKTVEIAESMGAKVFHFEWINDFSAAKNFAIKQAKGNWIAFLDADEYFSDKDTKALMMILRNVENDPALHKMKAAIRCAIVNVDDTGNPFLLLNQDRVFRNTPEIYYTGKIHEMLVTKDPCMNAPELSIIHTGYSSNAYAETGKAARNVEMIREELRRDPDNASLKCYLADSLRIPGDSQDIKEAEKLYREVISSGQPVLNELLQGAYNYLIATYFEDEDKQDETFELCRDAYGSFPQNPDFCYYYGRKLHLKNAYQDAWEKLTACEALLMKDTLKMGGYVLTHAMMLFFQMVLTAEELGNMPEVIRCATLVLKEDKYQHLMLAPYINAFNKPGYETSADEIFVLLGQLYDFNNLRDKLTVLQAAKSSGNLELVNIVLTTLSPEDLKLLTKD